MYLLFYRTDLFLYIVNGTTLVVVPPGEVGGIIGTGLGLDADVIGVCGKWNAKHTENIFIFCYNE